MVSSGERFVFASDFAFLSPIASGASAPSRKCYGWYHWRRRRACTKRLWRALAGAEIGRGFGSRRPIAPTNPSQVDVPDGIGDLFGENDNDAVAEFDRPAVPAGLEICRQPEGCRKGFVRLTYGV
jgi:hypothetical protein